MIRIRTFLVSVLCLAACDAVPVVAVRAGPAVQLAAPLALDAAGAAFVGPVGGGSLPGLGGDLLRSDAGTAVRSTRSRQVGVSGGLMQPLHEAEGGARLGLSAMLHLDAGQSAWHLPQGLGLFADPMDIRITTRSLAPELRAHWDRPVAGDTRIGLSGGAGLLLTQSRTQVRSALIALDHRSRQSQPYAVAGLSIRRALPGAARAGIALDVAAARPRGVQARLSAELVR